MKLKFSHKVFLAFLLNSFLIVVSMLLIGRYFAHRSFRVYIGKVQTQRLDELIETLGREYRKTPNWSSVLENIGPWLEINAPGPGHPQGEIFAQRAHFPPHHFPPAPPGEEDPGLREPPPFGGPHPDPSHHGPPQELPPPRPFPHIALFDAQKRPVIERGPSSPKDYALKPIKVDGRLVGWLGTARHERPMHPLDVEFLKQQSETFYAIGGIALLLALVVTFFLSRHILAPVKELAKGTRALTSRRFETRIEVRSQDELGQLASDFNDMAKALERYEQMRRQWMADISHELRTPLAVLRGEIEAMQDGVRQLSPQALDSLHFEVLHVGRIVNDLHDLSLIESNGFDSKKTPLDPISILEETLKAFYIRFEKRGLRIEAQERDEKRRVTVMADADRLKQLFSNLFENSLRYTGAPGLLRISHELTPAELLIHIEDSGPGVPEESLSRLFDRLYRVDEARSRAEGGSGLGLSICKSIVESFGGRIEARHASLGGLGITVAFPLLSA